MAREPGPSMSVAGIVDDPDTRARVIPASRRADGSIRKERKVKPGFTPAEDVGRFRPSRVLRAEAEAKQQGRQRIPGYETPAIEATRKAMASASISNPPYASPPSLANATAKASDGDWRRNKDVVSSGGSSSRGWESPVAPSHGGWRSREALRTSKEHAVNAAEEVPDDWEDDEKEDKVNKESSKDDEEEPEKEEKSECDANSATSTDSEEVAGRRKRSLGKKSSPAPLLKDGQKYAGKTLLPEQEANTGSLETVIKDLKALGMNEEEEEVAA